MDKVNQALGILLEMVKSTKDFVGDQAPRVAQEIVSYAFWDAMLWLSMWLIGTF